MHVLGSNPELAVPEALAQNSLRCLAGTALGSSFCDDSRRNLVIVQRCSVIQLTSADRRENASHERLRGLTKPKSRVLVFSPLVSELPIRTKPLVRRTLARG